MFELNNLFFLIFLQFDFLKTRYFASIYFPLKMYKTKKRVKYVQERKTEIIGDPILITQYNKMEDIFPPNF